MAFQFSLNPVKYEDVRSQVVEFLKNNSEFSGQFDFTQSNIGLIIDTMAYVTTMMSYQVSNVANNLFLESTSIRKNALSIAKTMGYRPQRVNASVITGKIKYYDPTSSLSGHTITIPPYTPFLADTGYQYINFDEIVLTYTSDYTLSADVTLYEGSVKTFTYLGTGTPFQKFIIPSKKIDEFHFELRVRKNTENSGLLWEEVKQSFNLLDRNAYFLEEDINSEGYLKVVFGDKDIVNYPGSDEVVDIIYLETNADIANNSTIVDKVFSYLEFSAGFPNYNESNFLTLSNYLSKSYNGTPLETLELIQERAPKSFVTAGRAVTKNDYITLLESDRNVFKGNAIGGDTLYPDDHTKLGNVYLTAIPYYNTNSIYLSPANESQIMNYLERYRIIATQMIFLKPTYIGLAITPYVEIKPNASAIEKETITSNVNSVISTFAATFDSFSPSLRSTKINSVINAIPGVISSSFNSEYFFKLCKDSFYINNPNNDVIFLPITGSTKDTNGNILEYTNFVRTNKEQMEILGLDVLPVELSTIYGKIETDANLRYIYSVDVPETNGDIKKADLYIEGKNTLFNLYTFSDPTKNIITNKKEFKNDLGALVSIVTTPSGENININWTNDTTDYLLGTVVKTTVADYGFKGWVGKETDITDSPSDGDFYRIGKNMSVSGADKDFSYIVKDKDNSGTNVIIYNSLVSGGMWLEGNYKGTISAYDDSALLPNIVNNSIYSITSSGDFNGQTPYVTDGEKLIYNPYSSTNFLWEKMRFKNEFSYTLDQSQDIVKEVVGYQMAQVINIDDSETTTFGGRTNPVSAMDLIYYNPLIVNTEIDHSNIVFQDIINGNKYTLGASGEDVIFNIAGPAYSESASADRIIKDITSGVSYLLVVATTGATPELRIDALSPLQYSVYHQSYFHIKDENNSSYNLYAKTVSGAGQLNLVKEIPEMDKWILISHASTGLEFTDLDPIDPTDANVLETFDYTSGYNIKLGDAYVTNNDGDFGNSNWRINWLSENDTTAVYGDVILYVGDGRWDIFQRGAPAEIDGSKPSSLPLELTYGDYFVVSCTGVSGGDFNDPINFVHYDNNDKIVYVGNDTWVKYESLGSLDASSENLPVESRLGDYYLVVEDGNFNNNLTVAPASASFIQGDYLIFNGTNYTKLNEYTFEYWVDLYTDSRNIINDTLDLNSVFHYDFNYDTKNYDMYFNDMYDGIKIGTFRYTSDTLTNTKYEVGKIIFENYINGNKNYQETTGSINIRELFDEFTKNEIKFLPKKKRDGNGNITTEDESNFETNFNTYILVTKKETGLF